MNNYSGLLLKMRAIVNKYDPGDLIAYSAPLDEYDDFTARIISMFISDKISDPGEGALILRDYFIKIFPKHADWTIEKYKSFAEEIIECLKAEKSL